MEFDKDENNDGGLVPKFGAIFMSNIGTHRECIKRKLFGLPIAQVNFVKQVRSGMILFLFEFERRELHGVFQATSDGMMNIMPHAFSSSGKQFPAQVRIAPIWSCGPLPEVVFRKAIKDNYFSPKKFNFGLSKNQVCVLLQLFYSTRLTNRLPQRQIANEISRGDRNKRHLLDDTGLKLSTRMDNPDVHLIKKRKINDDAGVSMHDDVRFSEGDMVENVCVAESFIRPNFSSDHREALRRSGENVYMDFVESTQSKQLYADSIKPNLESHSLALHDQLQHSSAFQSPNRSNSFTQTYLPSNNAMRAVPYNPEFPDMNYQCPSHIVDSLQDYTSQQVFDENFLPLSSSESVTYDEAGSLAGCLNVYSGNGSDTISFSSTCDHQIISSEGTNNTILKARYPETTKSTTYIHKADNGSLYSEPSLARPSVFTRLSAAVEEDKNDNDDKIGMVHDECDMLASVSEVMDLLHQARNRWLKDEDYRPSLGQQKGTEHVRRKEESKVWNHQEIEQPVVTKEMGTDINHLIDGDSDVVLRETRVVDFKRRSQKNKKLDDMVTKDSMGVTASMTSADSVKTSVDATRKALLGKPAKSRKLIRPDFSKTGSPVETNNGDSTLYCRSREHFCEDDSTNCQDACKRDAITDMPSGNAGLVHANNNRSTLCEDSTSELTPTCKVSRNVKMLHGASDIHQEGSDGKQRLQDMESVYEISEVPPGVTNQNVKHDLEIENQVKLSIQDLVSSLPSRSSAEHSPSLSTDITSVHSGEMHQSVMNGLGVENQVKLSIQDIDSSTSAQHFPSLSTDVTTVPPSETNQNVKNGLGIENQAKLSFQDLVSSTSTQHSPSILTDVTAISPSEVNQNVKNALGIENQVKLSIKDLVSSLTSSSGGQDSLSSLMNDTTVPEKLEGKDDNVEINDQVDSGANNFEQASSLQRT